VSTLDDLTGGTFHPVIDETQSIEPKQVRRLVFCSGKVYYDLARARNEKQLEDVAVVRIEELYPFPVERYAEVIGRYCQAVEIVWCQEEPQNQGAWYQIRHRLQEPLSAKQELFYSGRPGAAAPASGIHKLHVIQQQGLVDAALTTDPDASKGVKPRAPGRAQA
jgi:2-oxoglutarate dehydrogenase E1 component